MSSEHGLPADASSPTPTSASSLEAAPQHDAIEPTLRDLENFVNGLLAAPAPEVDSAVVALVRGAMRVRPRFASALALRALRLEHGLRQAQQEVIRLQWELAQLRRQHNVSWPRVPELED